MAFRKKNHFFKKTHYLIEFNFYKPTWQVLANETPKYCRDKDCLCAYIFVFLQFHCSPVIRKIRTDCAGEFSVFERCLRENQSSAEACQPHLTRFLACVETVDLSGIGKQ